MSGTNSNILQSYNPNQQIGPDFGAIVANSQRLLQFKQQQDQVKQQNALMGVFQDPTSLDATGQPTPETLQKVTAINPQFGLQLRQNAMIQQERQLRTQAVSSKLMADKMNMIGEGVEPIMESYDAAIKAGTPPEQAQRDAQAALMQTNERLKQSGIFTEDDARRFPTTFDPIQMRNVVAGTKQWQDHVKEQLAAQKQDDLVKRYGQMGQQQVTLANGRQAVFRPGEPDPTKQYTYAGTNEPVDPKDLGNLAKTGTGGGSPAAAAKKDDDLIAAYGQKPPAQHTQEETDAYNAAMARRQSEVNRKAEVAGATTKARQDATEDAGVPETPDQRAATAAQLATGEPITQVIPGWGKAAAAARNQARLDAIQLIRDQTGKDAVEAGIEFANRGIEYASGKKAQGLSTTMLTMTRQAVSQLDYNIAQAKTEMKKLGSTDLSPVLNAIARQEEQWTGNPAYSALFYNLSAVGMESARILSGGQASIQQLHEGAAREAQKWVNMNMTPAMFDGVSQAITEEGHFRLKTFDDAIKASRVGEPPKIGDTGTTTQTGQASPTDADKAYLRANPDKAAMFEKHFGLPAGAAQQIISGQGTQTGRSATATKPDQGAQQVATPTTQAEFDQLPSGARYINPADGKTYKKN